MAIGRVDSKKRLRIPTAKPGEVFDIRSEAEGQYILVRLEVPREMPGKTREESLKAIAESPLCPELSWEELRRITREP